MGIGVYGFMKSTLKILPAAAFLIFFAACSAPSGLQVGLNNGTNNNSNNGNNGNNNGNGGTPPVCGAQNTYLQTQTFLPGQLSFHATGFLDGQFWEVNPAYPEGALTYGPYTGRVPLGFSLATYTLTIDNNTSDTNKVLWVDVFDSSKNQTLAIHYIHRTDFTAVNTAQTFQLGFVNTGICDLEARSIYTAQGGTIVHQKTTFFQPTTATPFTVTDGSLSADFANSYLSTTPAFTFSAWFNTTQSGTILGYQDTDYPATPTAAWIPAIYVGTGGHLRVSLNLNAQAVSANVVNDGTWHYVALVASISGQTVYLDGAAIGTVAGVVVPNLTYNQIGNGYTSGGWANLGGNGGWFPFVGQLGNIGLYSTAYTSQQIQADYLANKPQ